jgi:D-alanyl-D-alanine endopeptidase (penicillin-binding protein 7)
MSGNFLKFLFLAVMMVVAAISGQKAVPPSADLLGANLESIKKFAQPPIFFLQSASQMTKSDQVLAVNASSDITAEYNSIAKKILGDVLQTDISTPAADMSGNNEDAQKTPVGSGGVLLESDNSPSSSAFRRYGNDPPPAVGANSALIADLKTGEMFFNPSASSRWPLASLTKLMTAAVISQNIPLNQSTTLSVGDFPLDSADGDMKPGERYSIGDFRLAMLLESNNEAATALANFYGYDKFIAAMNAKAGEWGLSNTHFDDPAGLSASNQSTAMDLLYLAEHIYSQNPEVFKITYKQSGYITELNSKKRILIKTINNFASRPDFLGGKTGYTDEASGNLLSIFSYNRRPVLIVVLGTEDRFGDTEKLLNWFEANYK